MTSKGKILKLPKFTVEVRYSEEAIAKKSVRFTVTEGKSFEITADELINILVSEVNTDILAPTFVDIEKINVVEVGRQLQCVLDKDMKKGDKININYTHPYPIEFALIEQAYGIAKINLDVPALSLTKEYIESVRAKTTTGMRDYVEKFYKSFKNLTLSRK